jgi:hypothetical protein
MGLLMFIICHPYTGLGLIHWVLPTCSSSSIHPHGVLALNPCGIHPIVAPYPQALSISMYGFLMKKMELNNSVKFDEDSGNCEREIFVLSLWKT